jgi:hypothetical protein
MAAARANFNNYLNAMIGINDAALVTAINGQGLEGFDDFLMLTEDDIGNICTNVRKPGGTIPNPAYDPNNIVPNIPATIPNPGRQLGRVYEKRLKMLRYYVHHLQRIQRVIVANQATLDRLVNCYRLKDAEDEDEDVELPQKLLKTDKVRDVLEDIDNYLVRKLGSSGLPLAYVVREEVALPLVDPGYGQPTTTDD